MGIKLNLGGKIRNKGKSRGGGKQRRETNNEMPVEYFEKDRRHMANNI